MPRIPYGLDRLPRSLSLDDPRLPAASAGSTVLRLNSEQLPATAMPDAIGDHAARVAAMKAWLVRLCGDYAPLRIQFIGTYVDFIAAQIVANRTALAEGLRRYDGLYGPEDWLWSAPRPLPRAWLPAGDGLQPAEIAFWDGARALAISLAGREAAQPAAGVTVLRVEPAALADPATLGAMLPDWFHGFWRGEVLPASPFRQAIPRGVATE